ncbi:hypothetical protein [Streptomyces sp. KL116D]|uniref:hypothetical protein n=1 Tax=Streptomyces sp. KL116D TaxID=3045152 RepID=UPI003555D582
MIGAAAAPVAAADSASLPCRRAERPVRHVRTRRTTAWRQSLAFVAQDTVGVKPAGKAVDWLAGAAV